MPALGEKGFKGSITATYLATPSFPGHTKYDTTNWNTSSFAGGLFPLVTVGYFITNNVAVEVNGQIGIALVKNEIHSTYDDVYSDSALNTTKARMPSISTKGCHPPISPTM